MTVSQTRSQLHPIRGVRCFHVVLVKRRGTGGSSVCASFCEDSDPTLPVAPKMLAYRR